MLLMTGKERCIWIEHRFFVLWIGDGELQRESGRNRPTKRTPPPDGRRN